MFRTLHVSSLGEEASWFVFAWFVFAWFVFAWFVFAAVEIALFPEQRLSNYFCQALRSLEDRAMLSGRKNTNIRIGLRLRTEVALIAMPLARRP